MRPPVPISTLLDAAKWLSELAGAPMTEREVLGHAFNFQWAAERPLDDDGQASSEATATERAAERIVHLLIPGDVEMRLRRWRLDGYTDRPATMAERVVALDSYELFDLLTHDRAVLTLPRLTDPYQDDEHAEFMLEAAPITLEQIRIFARGLYILAAWWQSTVGARKAAPQEPQPAPSTPEGSAGASGDASADTAAGAKLQTIFAPLSTKDKEPAGGDTLTPVVWSICYELKKAGRRVTAIPVMAELKSRADSCDKQVKGCLVSSTAGGIKFEDANGEEQELMSKALKYRINAWKESCDGR